MMSEMVERVAREMKSGAFAVYDKGYDWFNPKRFLNAERTVKQARRDARKAIAAMREPTKAMLAAGGDAMPADDLATLPADLLRPAWIAAIDAALNEEPAGS